MTSSTTTYHRAAAVVLLTLHRHGPMPKHRVFDVMRGRFTDPQLEIAWEILLDLKLIHPVPGQHRPDAEFRRRVLPPDPRKLPYFFEGRC